MLVTAADAVFAPSVQNIRLGLQPAAVPADDAVYAVTTTRFLEPSMVKSPTPTLRSPVAITSSPS